MQGIDELTLRLADIQRGQEDTTFRIANAVLTGAIELKLISSPSPILTTPHSHIQLAEKSHRGLPSWESPSP